MTTSIPLIPENWDNLPVILYPNPILRHKCLDIDREYPIANLLAAMNKILDQSMGLGLSAPQLGLPVHVFIGLHRQVFINAVILELKGLQQIGNEGCLSIPGVRGRIARYQKLKLQWFDENWVRHTATFRAKPAIVIQHEYDHCEGVLWFDHLKEKDKPAIANGLDKLEKGIVPPVRHYYPMAPYVATPTK